MVSTCKKRRPNRRLLNQLDEFDQNFIVGNTVGKRQEIAKVNEGTGDPDFTVDNLENNLTSHENVVNVKTLERCFNEKFDREMSNFVGTTEDRIQNAILTAIDCIVAPQIELAIRSVNASCGLDAINVTANSERGEHIGITAPFENVSERNNTLHVLNMNETRSKIPDEVSELSVPDTHFDRQPNTHHTLIIEYIADNTSSSSLSLVPLILSDNIPACSSLRSSPASFQSASRSYFCSAAPRLASLVGSRGSIQLYLIRNKIEIIKLRIIFTKTPLANFLILHFQAYLSEHSRQSSPSIFSAFSSIKT